MKLSGWRAGWRLLANCCIILLIVGGSSSSRALAEGEFDIKARILDITSRSTWKHLYSFPPHLLAKGLTILGDDSRLNKFIRKMIKGEPVTWALLGGSISTSRGAAHVDMQWHSVMQKWMELTFTDCGRKYPDMSPREHSTEWNEERHACNNLTPKVTYKNMAIGATSNIVAEKCNFQWIPQDVDLVMLEFTMNAWQGHLMEINTLERRAMERLMRKILKLPNAPALVVFHTFSGWTIELGDPFAPAAEDYHNMLLSYYGNVQALSVRNVLWDMVIEDKGRLNKTELWDIPPSGQYMHPERSGVLIYSDIMIHWLQRTTKKVMSEMLAEELIPASVITDKPDLELEVYSEYCKIKMLDTCKLGVSPLVKEYVAAVEAENSTALPPPLIPGNYEDADGFCLLGESLRSLYHNHTGSWELKDDSRSIHGNHKWGYTGTNPGDKLIFKIDTTLRGHIGDGSLIQEVTSCEGEKLLVNGSRVDLQVGYLKTFENIGMAEVQCVSGCECESKTIDALWNDTKSIPVYERFNVSAHPECLVQVTILEKSSTNSHRFKVEGIILSHVPFMLSSIHIGLMQIKADRFGQTDDNW